MKHWRYLKYLLRHKWFVFVAGLRLGVPLWRLIIHDWSKFLPSEWFPYVQFFYGEKLVPGFDAEEIAARRANFDRAWLHHQHFNPHHWQHWVLRMDDGRTEPLDMPDHFVSEMVADWAGAGRAITGKWEFKEWFSRNQHKMRLSQETHSSVWRLVNMLDVWFNVRADNQTQTSTE